MLEAVSTPQEEAKPVRIWFPKPIVVDKPVSHLYKVIQKSTGSVGGYGHNGPVYGEITVGTFQKVVNALAEHTGFDASSSFMDIGSGLGKPNLHVALNPGVRLSYGVEIEELRWQLSMHNLRFVMKEVPEMRESVVYFGHEDATNMGTFEPFTHIYMFDIGFPPSVLVSLANAFNTSKTVQGLVSFQKPKKVIGVYGFNVELVTQISTNMYGSSEGHTAYIYSAKATKGRRQLQIDFPRDSPVKKASTAPPASPVKEEVKKSVESPVKSAVKTVTPIKSKLRGAKPKQSSAAVAPKMLSLEFPTKKPSMLAKLQAEDYSFWVNNTGVIADNKRPTRTRKQVDLKELMVGRLETKPKDL